MRVFSTEDSVERGEVSILAIIETLLAITLVFYLSAHLNTLRWLSVAMCVSPMMLLRTEESTRLGVAWTDALINRFTRSKPGMSVGSALALIFFGGLPAAFAIRIAATFLGLFRTPHAVARAIPLNWSRITLCIDSLVPPDLIPGHEHVNLKFPLAFMRFDIRLSLFVAPFLLLFVPALFYRWSLKATSIIYAPLVFVVHTTFRETRDLRTKLQLITRSDLMRVLALYALCYVTAFLTKLMLMMNLPGFAGWWNGSPVRQFAALYVAPGEIPKWQLASLINCAIALGIWFFARHALLRIEIGTPWRATMVQRLLGLATGLRTVLAFYTIACTAYITLRAARSWHWPVLGEKWLPWQ